MNASGEHSFAVRLYCVTWVHDRFFDFYLTTLLSVRPIGGGYSLYSIVLGPSEPSVFI